MLAFNSGSSYFSLSNVRIIGVFYHTWLGLSFSPLSLQSLL